MKFNKLGIKIYIAKKIKDKDATYGLHELEIYKLRLAIDFKHYFSIRWDFT